jgi:endonuclease/exonuclease/phosphatase family metal-dependent hydrolase
MKIATYNIHGWRTADGAPNLDRIAQLLADIEADIVGLNEVFYPRRVTGADKPALAALAARLNMHFVFGPCLRWPAQDDLPADAYGNALLSRWPIIASAAHHLTPKEAAQQALLAEKEQRGLLEARILLPDERTFTVYVTHLDHTDEEARLVQLRSLRSWTQRDRNRPHVVMGDFNTISPWDVNERPDLFDSLTHSAKGNRLLGGETGPRVVAQMEKAGYTDAYRLFGTPGQRTFLTSPHPIRIDYIFASSALIPRLQSCHIWADSAGQLASDHLPVVADIAPLAALD